MCVCVCVCVCVCARARALQLETKGIGHLEAAPPDVWRYGSGLKPVGPVSVYVSLRVGSATSISLWRKEKKSLIRSVCMFIYALCVCTCVCVCVCVRVRPADTPITPVHSSCRARLAPSPLRARGVRHTCRDTIEHRQIDTQFVCLLLNVPATC